MKLLIVLAMAALAAARPDDDVYRRYEDYDYESVLQNHRLFQAYIKCVLGTGKCTPEGKDLKIIVPEAIQNTCLKCSDKMKPKVAKVIVAVQQQFPEDWQQLNKDYNPDGKYDVTLNEFLEKYGH